MQAFDDSKLGRRQFLAGAAYAVGAATLALSMEQEVQAAKSNAAAAPDLVMGYVDGEHMISIDRVRGDDSLLGQPVRLTISARNSGKTFASIDAHFAQDSGEHAVFHAWHMSGPDAAFTMPVSTDGVRLSANVDGADVSCRLPANALKTGTYVLSTGHGFAIAAEEAARPVLLERTLGGLVPARFDHVFVTVERA